MSIVFLLLVCAGIAWAVGKVKKSAEVASGQVGVIRQNVAFDLNFKRMGFEVSISTSESKLLLKRPFVSPILIDLGDIRSWSTEWVDRSTALGVQQSNFKVILLLRSMETPRVEIPVPNKNVAAQLIEMIQQGLERSGRAITA